MASWGLKHYFSIIILLAVLFGACSGEEKLPEDILSEAEMTSMIIQIHLLEAKIGKARIKRDSSIAVYQYFEKELFKELGMDSAMYYKSFDYYSKHPEAFSKVYVAVGDSLMEMEAKEKLKVEAQKQALKESDSLAILSDSLRIATDSLLLDSIAPTRKRPILIKRLNDSSSDKKRRRF